MKKIWTYALSLMVLSLFVMPLPIHAATSHIVDDADLLTTEEEMELDKKANQIAQDYDINVLVLTTYEVGYSDMYARDYIEEYGEQHYPDGYIGYCIDMSDRSYWVDGYGPEVLGYFDQSDTDNISSATEDHLSDLEFGESVNVFLKRVDSHLAKETKKYGFFTNIILNKTAYIAVSVFGALAAILIAWLMTLSKVQQHKDKKINSKADEYSDPVHLEGKSDQLMHTYQTRTPIPKANSGGYSGGGGGGHVGSGGHF